MDESQSALYQIRVQGKLDGDWLGCFEGLVVSVEPDSDGAPVTTLTMPAPDQALLRGILNRLWDLNLSVICVNRVSGSTGG